jgi:SAM-dependent methyltransferase
MTHTHDPGAYGAGVASRYDDLYGAEELGTEGTVAFLHDLAGPGAPILELGVGTGRLALPLLALGHPVTGIEASPAMIAALRAKPEGTQVHVIEGDFSVVKADGAFRVATIVFNALFALGTRQAQIACLRNVAESLQPDGCLVLEAYVLRPEQMGTGWCVLPRMVSNDHVELQLSRYDPATHRLVRTLVHLRTDDTLLTSVSDTYAWPGEIDLMAETAGLRLRSRSGGWGREPFDSTCVRHISVYVPARLVSPRRV